MKGCRNFYTTLPWEKKTSSATGRYWIGFTTNATSTSKMSPNAGTKLNGCWMMKDYSRNGRDPHICHTHLTDVQRPPQPAVADLTGMAGSHRKAHPEHQLWGKVKARENSCYLLEKEDDEFLYVKDLCSEDEGEFKITKKSLNLSAIRSREAGKAPLSAN